MLFNSLEFLIFFAVVYGLYLLLQHRWQNWLLIIASCLFYAAWNWKFLFIMFISISTDFWCSRLMDRTDSSRKRFMFLCLSLGVNLFILGFFKYYNFFISNVQGLFQYLHIFPASLNLTLKIILPLGVSFYTFEAISYVVDVYRKQIKPAQRYWDYVLFVIYFPHLIAGPIMRAKDFLPQITTARKLSWEQFFEGNYLFFWGLFEKIFIADNLARIVNPVFASVAPYDAGKVIVALYAFAFQIFCDFDGYSNMARGLGKCMGFEITINFRLPYFAKNPREFWHRWHISLSTWLRDYIYIPLGGNRLGDKQMYLSLLVTMLLGGLWHGASWTFLVWGLYHGILLITHRFIEKMGGKKESAHADLDAKPLASRIFNTVKVIVFFHLIVLGWLFFRATSMTQVFEMLTSIFGLFQTSSFLHLFPRFFLIVIPLLLVQLGQYYSGNLMWLFEQNKFIKIACYALFTYLILGFGVMNSQEFIYFQF